MGSRPDGWSRRPRAAWTWKTARHTTQGGDLDDFRSKPVTIADDVHRDTAARQIEAAPIVAAVDGSAASTVAVETAVNLAAELDAPIVFVYVRRGPAGFLGTPVYQRQLTAEMVQGRRVLGEALEAAAAAGVDAEGEILEGAPAAADYRVRPQSRRQVRGRRLAPPEGRAQRLPWRRPRSGPPGRRRSRVSAGSP